MNQRRRAFVEYPPNLAAYTTIHTAITGGSRGRPRAHDVPVLRHRRSRDRVTAPPKGQSRRRNVLANAQSDAHLLSSRSKLADGARTPYEYVERVLDHLGTEGYSYSEDPPRAGFALAASSRAIEQGYCQQFSGAMALLLRMGGVPARVSTGFSPGRRIATAASTSCATPTRTPGWRPTSRPTAG